MHQDPGNVCHSSKTLPRHRISQHLSTTVQSSKTLPRQDRHLRPALKISTEEQKTGENPVISPKMSKAKSSREHSSSASWSKAQMTDTEKVRDWIRSQEGVNSTPNIELNCTENNKLIRSSTLKSGKRQRTKTDTKYATVREKSNKVLQPSDVKPTSRNIQGNSSNTLPKSKKKDLCENGDAKRKKSLKETKSKLDKPASNDGNHNKSG